MVNSLLITPSYWKWGELAIKCVLVSSGEWNFLHVYSFFSAVSKSHYLQNTFKEKTHFYSRIVGIIQIC